MNEYGVWLKNEADEILVFNGTLMACQRYTEIETAKDVKLLNRWRIGPLPQYRVESTPKGHPMRIMAAYDTMEAAILYAREYLELSEGLIEPEDVKITG